MMDPQAYLFSLPRFAEIGAAAMKPGLDRIHDVLSACGNPHNAYPVIHIAGTNGKGSTAAFIASMGRTSGCKVGLHTSPHLVRVHERMRVNGQPPTDEWLNDRIIQLRPTFDRVGVSFFEATVALSFLYFAENQVDFAVIETGLGGRLDATNIVTPVVSVITSIGYDHVDILGGSLAQIAREKSGIIKPHTPVVVAVDKKEALDVITAAAREKEAPLHDVYREVDWEVQAGEGFDSKGLFKTPLNTYRPARLGLPGRHQFVNVASALRAFEIFFPKEQLDVKAVHKGIESVRKQTGFRGRLEIVHLEPLIALDVCHNYDSLGATLQFMKEAVSPRSGHLFVAFGTMRDKDVEQMISLIAASTLESFVVPLHSERALPAGELKAYITRAGVPAQIVTDAQHAVQLFLEKANPEDGLLVAGSHLVVSQLPDYIADIFG